MFVSSSRAYPNEKDHNSYAIMMAADFKTF
jgi:hypothetical protein